MKDPQKIYVDVPFEPKFLERIMEDGEKNRRNRVQQILFILEQWYQREQPEEEQEESRWITSAKVEKKLEKFHEPRRKTA